MASPLDKLSAKFRGASGALGQTSTEEAGVLASASGLPVQPTNPMGGAAIGASPASAAMLGSSANKQSALRTAIQGGMSQDTNERIGTAQIADKEAQAKKAEEAARLGTFAGALDTRVQQLVQQKVTAATTDQANAQTGLKVDKAALASVDPANAAELEGLLSKLGSNTANNSDIARINALMGKVNIGEQLDANTLKSKFLTGSAQIGEALAAGLGDSLKVGDADVASLGAGSKADIAALLGMDETALDQMSVTELLGDIQDEQQKQFTSAQQLQQSSISPLLGQAERAAARQALRGASASGVLSAEDSIKDIDQQIAEANTIKFAGEDVSVEKLLTDEYLSGVVANYLADPMSEMSQDLAKNNPDLKDWINANKAGLDKLAGNIDQETADFAALQYENQKLKTPEGAGTIDDSAMKALIPDWGQLRGEAYTKPPLFATISNPNIDAGVRANLVAGINKLANFDPSRVSEMAGMDYNALRTLGLDKAENMQRYVDNAQAGRTLEVAPTNTPAAFLGTFGVDGDQFTNDALKSRRLSAIGIGDDSGTQLLDILDPDGDGIIQPEHIANAKSKFASMFKGTKLSELLASGQSTATLPTMASLADALKPKGNGSLPADIQNRIEKEIADGDFEEGSAYAMFRNARDVPLSKLQELSDKLTNNRLVGGYAYKGIREAAVNRTVEDYENDLPGALKGSGWFQYYDRAVNQNHILEPVAVQQLRESIAKISASQQTTEFGKEAKNKLLANLKRTVDFHDMTVARQNTSDSEAAARAQEELRKDVKWKMGDASEPPPPSDEQRKMAKGMR